MISASDVGSVWPFETDDTVFDKHVLDCTDLCFSGTFCSCYLCL